MLTVKGLEWHFLASFWGQGENASDRLLGCGQDSASGTPSSLRLPSASSTPHHVDEEYELVRTFVEQLAATFRSP